MPPVLYHQCCAALSYIATSVSYCNLCCVAEIFWRLNGKTISVLGNILRFFSYKRGIVKYIWNVLKSDPHLPKKLLFICFNEIPLKMMENPFYFILKALFFRRKFKFLSRHLCYWCHNLVNKHLQYIYCPISHEVKGTRYWNLVS